MKIRSSVAGRRKALKRRLTTTGSWVNVTSSYPFGFDPSDNASAVTHQVVPTSRHYFLVKVSSAPRRNTPRKPTRNIEAVLPSPYAWQRLGIPKRTSAGSGSARLLRKFLPHCLQYCAKVSRRRRGRSGASPTRSPARDHEAAIQEHMVDVVATLGVQLERVTWRANSMHMRVVE